MKLYFKKIINLMCFALFIVFLFLTIYKTLSFLSVDNIYSEFELMKQDTTPFGTLINFFSSTWSGTNNVISIYISVFLATLFNYGFILGLLTLMTWIILRVMLLITTFGGKINV